MPDLSVWRQRARAAFPAARVLVVLALVPLLVSPDRADDTAASASVSVAEPRHEIAPAPDPSATPSDDGLTTQPGAVAAPPPAAAPPAAIPDEVEPLQPDLLVRPAGPLQPEGLFSVLGVQGVQHLAGAVEVGATLDAPVGRSPVGLLVVDPIAFRPLTPDVTARTREVWERLLEGEMVVRHDVAQRLQLPLGGTVTVTGPNGEPRTVRVGAFASNGTPPVAEAIVSWEVGGTLGATSPNLLVVAVADDTEPGPVGEAVQAALGGAADVRPVQPPAQQEARLAGTGSHQFEPFSYIDHGDGMITIDPDWVRRNIVTAQLPIYGGTARCHRTMMPQLIAALQEVEASGLAHHIDRSDYGGCWVPRHILFNPSRPISMHAWGLAVDLNVRTNGYGANPTLDPAVVAIFEKWGFRWGGDFSTPDGMHFELRAVVGGQG